MTQRLRSWLKILGCLALLAVAPPASAQPFPGFTPGLPVYVLGRVQNAIAMVQWLQGQGITAYTYLGTGYTYGSGTSLLTGSAANTVGAELISAGNVGFMQAAASEVVSGSAQMIIAGDGIGSITITEAAIATDLGATITPVAMPGSAAFATEVAAADAEAAASAVSALAGVTVSPAVVTGVAVAGVVIIGVQVGAIIYYCNQAGGVMQCFDDPSSAPACGGYPDGGTISGGGGGSGGGGADGGPGGWIPDAGTGSPDGGGGIGGGGTNPPPGQVGQYGYCGCSWASLYCGGTCQPGLTCDWTGTCM